MNQPKRSNFSAPQTAEKTNQESFTKKVNKIPVTFYGWILAGICLIALIIVGFFAYTAISHISSSTKREIAQIKEDGNLAKIALNDYLEVQLLQSKIQNLEDEKVRREHFRLAGSQLIIREQPVAHRRMTAEQIHVFLDTIYGLSKLEQFQEIGIVLPLAFARVESVFNPNAAGRNINDRGEILSHDHGLFQFNSAGTAQYVAIMIGETYRPRMEFEIETSVKMWFKFYLYIKNYLEEIRPFETKEEEIKFVAYAYNRGYVRGREAWWAFDREKHSMDNFLTRLYSNSINPQANSRYHIDIYNTYLRLLRENESFILINFSN
jgi:hypothetical protein